MLSVSVGARRHRHVLDRLDALAATVMVATLPPAGACRRNTRALAGSLRRTLSWMVPNVTVCSSIGMTIIMLMMMLRHRPQLARPPELDKPRDIP